MEELALTLKEIHPTSWSIVMTNFGNAFFYNSLSKESHYEMPTEVTRIIEILATAIPSTTATEIQTHYIPNTQEKEFVDYYADIIPKTEMVIKVEYDEESARQGFNVTWIYILFTFIFE